MGQGSGHHIISVSTYIKIFAVLIGLTVLTVAVATPVTGVSFGALNALIAFGIASVKAALVLGFFMHLKYDDMMNRVIFGCAVMFLLLLWFVSILDIVTRVAQRSTL